MKSGLMGALTAAVASAGLAGAVLAADNEAGVPLAPGDAAGPWTLESGGHAICVLQLMAEKAGAAGLAVRAPQSCGGALPSDLAGWTPTADGMALTGSDGKVLIAFNRWSNSLFVSHQTSGVDIQLQRGVATP